jgi:23S rRNA (adenine2503-C2)-methyltransferase
MSERSTNILNFSQPELEAWMQDRGFERYRSRQIVQWFYKKGVGDFEGMSDLPKPLRDELHKSFYFFLPKIVERQKAKDRTVKFLFELEDGARVEAVLLRDQAQQENTLCISSQVGCKFGCAFCRTATMGFKRNLRSGEILGQYFTARAASENIQVHRIVIMGMGEALDNF